MRGRGHLFFKNVVPSTLCARPPDAPAPRGPGACSGRAGVGRWAAAGGAGRGRTCGFATAPARCALRGGGLPTLALANRRRGRLGGRRIVGARHTRGGGGRYGGGHRIHEARTQPGQPCRRHGGRVAGSARPAGVARPGAGPLCTRHARSARMTAMSDASSVSDEDRTALADTVTRFARTEIAPHVDAWDAAGEFPLSLYRRASDLGLLGLGYPEQYGGTPASYALRLPLWRALSRHGASGGVLASLLSHNIGLPPVLAHGSDAVRAEVIPPVLAGGQIAAR